MTDYALVFEDEIVETGHPTRAVVEEPVYETVDVLDDEGNVIGQRPEPTGDTHKVLTSVSLPPGAALTGRDYAALGWKPIIEQEVAYDPETQQLAAGPLGVVDGKPWRTWEVVDLPPPPPPPPEVAEDPAPISRREMVKILQAQGLTQQEAVDAVVGAREGG